MSDWPHSQDGIDPAMRPTHPDTIQTVTLTEAEQAALASGWNLALEAAAKAAREVGLLSVEFIRALSMPAPTEQEAVGVRVKPLVWREETPGYFFADEIAGLWRVHPWNGKYNCYRGSRSDLGLFPDAEAAKAAAEADHAARVMAMVEVVPAPPQPTEGGE